MKSLVWMLCFVVVLNSLCIAQTTNPSRQKPSAKPVSKAEATEPMLQQRRAIAVLESLVKETIALDDQPLSIKVRAKIADALWKYKQSRAREVFIEAFQAIDTIEWPPLPAPRKGVDEDAYIAGSKRFELCQEVLHLTARHDFELAEKMRASIAEKAVEKNSEADLKKAKREQVLQAIRMAQLLVKADPSKAAQLFRQILTSGFEPSLMVVLNEMRPVNAELANALFLEALAVARYSQGALMDTVGAFYYFFMLEMDKIIGRDSLSDASRALLQPFLSAAHEAISRHVAIESEGTPVITGQMAEEDYWALQQMTPLFTKHLPDALPTVRLRTAQLAKHLPNKEVESIQKAITNDYESYVKEAEAATDPKQKDQLYMRAAGQAVQQGKNDEAIRLADKIQNLDLYLASSIIRYQIALRAVSRDNIDEALRYARDIEFSPQRVLIYQKVAEKLIAQKDYQRATEILSEIERWLEASAEDAKKAGGLLEVAALVSSFDPTRGFEVTKLAVKAINNTDFKPPARKSEVHIKIDSLDFATAFAPLARADFERALLIAQSIQKKEAAIIAQVEICKAALVGTQSKKP